MPWRLFLALVNRAHRFDARRLLWAIDGARAAEARGLELELMRKRLEDLAFPWRADGQPVRFALKQSED